MSDHSIPSHSSDTGFRTPRSFLLWLLPDGRQLIQIDGIAISVPKYTGKYYRAKAAIRGVEAEAGGFLHVPKRQLLLDGRSYHESVYFLVEAGNVPAVAVDSVLGLEVMEELSPAELEAISNGIREIARQL